MKEQDLLKLKTEIDTAKDSVNQLKGQKTALLKQLQDEWNCTSIEEAEKRINKMKKEMETLEASIETGLEELENSINDKDSQFEEEIEKNKKAYSDSTYGKSNTKKYG